LIWRSHVLRVTTLARRNIHIDEVQHVSPSAIAHEERHGVVPRNVYRRSLVRPPLSHEEGKPSPIEEAARKDSAVHVSLSSDSLVKQPGTVAIPSPENRRAAETQSRRPKPALCHTKGEELRRRVITPYERTARRCGGYIGFGLPACQHRNPQISPPLCAVDCKRKAALRFGSGEHPRRTGATFLPRCSHRGKACGHGPNHG
jgi:hypothetical protein